MQRFELVNECFGEYSSGKMQLSPEGTYVLYDTALEEIKRLVGIIADLIEDIDQIRDLSILRGCSSYYNARDEVWVHSED